MTGDHLLDQFQLPKPQPDIYIVSKHAPVSIRDQIVRAVYLLERLWATKRLTAESRLLVVGAGACGVTAAIKAAHFGVKDVLLIEEKQEALWLQASCTSRWVDPVQYDWPASHWDGQVWPIDEPPGFPFPSARKNPPPVPLNAGFADDWAGTFRKALANAELNGEVRFLPDRKIVGYTRHKNFYAMKMLEVSSNMPAGHEFATVVILTIGFGSERVSLPVAGTNSSVSSSAYWDPDTFEKRNFGLHTFSDGVLVSGGGDGALQDYIRLVSGQQSARAVWKAIEPLIPQTELQRIYSLWHWDDHYRVTPAFAPDYAKTAEWLSHIQARYEQELTHLQVQPKLWSAVVDVLDRMTFGRPLNKVILVLVDDFLDRCYSLNRWVALLLIRFIKERHPLDDLVWTHKAARSVHAAGPAWGRKLDVEFVPADYGITPDEITQYSGPTTTRCFDGIVIRHGIDPKPLFIQTGRLQHQTVPAHLP